MYTLSIQVLLSAIVMGRAYLSNNITGLQVPQGLDKLVHGPVEIAFCVQIISIPAMNVCHPTLPKTGGPSERDRKCIQTPSVQHFELCRCGMFVQS
jgi:hypothetical protein